MTTIAPTEPEVRPDRLASPAVYRMTVDEYERMNGALDSDRVELIDGYLVTKMGKKPPHVWAVDSLDPFLRSRLSAARWTVRRESPVRIPKFDEPEPDLVIARGSRKTYRSRHPEPADIALVIEVSDTTYPWDRNEKWAAYARGGIPVYWIVNLAQGRIEVYTDPKGGRYQTQRDYHAGDMVALVIDGRRRGEIAVDDVLS
jgi:Uma2 family endonuclease